MGMGAMQLIEINVEEAVIKELAEYKRLSNRLRVLNKQTIGVGMSMEFSNPDDKLKDLHSRLKPLASYMYLSKKEQELETIAHAYLPRYALGTKSQLSDIRELVGNDAEDDKLLRGLEHKVEKVLESRRGDIEGYEGILNRMVEMQDIQDKLSPIESIFDIMQERKPHHVSILKLYIIDKMDLEIVIQKLCTSRTVFFRWRLKAIEQYAELSGLL